MRKAANVSNRAKIGTPLYPDDHLILIAPSRASEPPTAAFVFTNDHAMIGSLRFTFLFGVAIPLLLGTTTLGSNLQGHLQEARSPDAVRSVETPFQLLEAGRRFERQMSGGESQAYQVLLTTGQALHAIVDQLGLDVVVRLFRPDGKKVVDVDSPNGIHGSEHLWAIAEISGDYRLEVSSLEKKARPGRYDIRIEEPRAASQMDKDRVAAELAFMEGSELFHANNPESLKRAISKYKQSLEIRRALANDSGEAQTLYIIGVVYYVLGDREESLKHYSEALMKARADGDRPIIASALNEIGAVYASFENQNRAVYYYDQALVIFHELGDPPNEAIILSNIGAANESLGKSQKALESLKKSLLIMRSLDEHAKLSTTLNNIGHVYFAMGNTTQALDYYSEALPLYQELHDRAGEAGILNNIAQAIGNSRKQEALNYYNQALRKYREVGDDSHESAVLGNMAMLHELFGDTQEALDLYEQVIAKIEHLRASSTVDKIRAGLSDYSGQLGAVYKAGLLLAKRRQPIKFFNLTELVRGRTFLDQLGNIHPKLLKTENDRLSKESQELESKLTSLERQLERESDDLSPSLEREYAAAQLQYEDLLLEIELSNPAYASFRKVKPLKLSEVQSNINKDTTLLSYFVGREKSFAFVITRHTFRMVAIPVKEVDLKREIQWFRNFADPDQNASVKTLKRLHGWLIAPVNRYIKTTTVGIIPHGVLHYLPFAALTDGRRYFGDKHNLFYLPSVSTLPLIQKLRKPVGTHVLAVSQSRAPGFSFLPNVDRESNAVATIYNTQALTTGKALKSDFLKRAGTHSIVHIAAHADIHMASPLFYRVLLVGDNNQTAALELREVYDLNLTQTSLVVLSACETDLGARSSGDDIVALNRAFIYAGAPTVIASLWVVNDQSTSDLMISFYTHLKGGMRKAEALKAAQLDTRKKYPNPYYWAAFVLTGDPE